jgi:hypothetical protein
VATFHLHKLISNSTPKFTGQRKFKKMQTNLSRGTFSLLLFKASRTQVSWRWRSGVIKYADSSFLALINRQLARAHYRKGVGHISAVVK